MVATAKSPVSLVEYVTYLWRNYTHVSKVREKTTPIFILLHGFDTTGEASEAILELLMEEVEKEARRFGRTREYYGQAISLSKKSKRSDLIERMLAIAIQYGELDLVVELAAKVDRKLSRKEVWKALDGRKRFTTCERPGTTRNGRHVFGSELDKEDYAAFAGRYINVTSAVKGRISRMVSDLYRSLDPGDL